MTKFLPANAAFTAVEVQLSIEGRLGFVDELRCLTAERRARGER